MSESAETALQLREFADALDADRGHNKSMVTRIMRDAANEIEVLQDKLHPPSDEGKAPATAGQNSQRRSETGDGSTAAYDQEDTCLEQPQASGMDSASGSESRSLSPGASSCSSRAASSAAKVLQEVGHGLSESRADARRVAPGDGGHSRFVLRTSFGYPERYFDGDAQAFRYRIKRFETWLESDQKMGRWEWEPWAGPKV